MKQSLRSWLWRVDVTREVDEEIAFHVEMRTESSSIEAWPRGLRARWCSRGLGDVGGLKRTCVDLGRKRDREMRLTQFIEELRASSSPSPLPFPPPSPPPLPPSLPPPPPPLLLFSFSFLPSPLLFSLPPPSSSLPPLLPFFLSPPLLPPPSPSPPPFLLPSSSSPSLPPLSVRLPPRPPSFPLPLSTVRCDDPTVGRREASDLALPD